MQMTALLLFCKSAACGWDLSALKQQLSWLGCPRGSLLPKHHEGLANPQRPTGLTMIQVLGLKEGGGAVEPIPGRCVADAALFG